MPSLLSVKQQSLESDIYGCVLLFSDELHVAHLIHYLQKLSRLWNLPRAGINMIKLQVESNGQKHQNWCSTDWHFHRKLGRSEGPRLQERAGLDSSPSPDPAAWVAPLRVYENRLTAGRRELFVCTEMCHSWSVLSTLCDHKLWARHGFSENTVFFLIYYCCIGWGE